jgi:predicted ATPase
LRARYTDGPVPGSFFDSEIYRDFALYLDEWAAKDPGMLDYFGGKSLMVQSHGQSHMAFFEHRFSLKGLYLLDEPENALSPKTQLRLLDVLKNAMAANHSQFIIATHSPILLSLDGAHILGLDSAPIDKIDYKDTEQYKVYRDFFQNV